jgi:hypothetical protein
LQHQTDATLEIYERAVARRRHRGKQPASL